MINILVFNIHKQNHYRAARFIYQNNYPYVRPGFYYKVTAISVINDIDICYMK